MKQAEILQAKAYEHIRNMIISGSFQFDTVYSESGLARELGISRTPVRDAIHKLSSEGYIDILPSRGFVLHSLNLSEALQLLNVRSAIEGFCCYNAVSSLDKKEFDELIKVLDDSIKRQKEFQKSSSDKDIVAFVNEDMAFHYFLIKSSKNSFFKDTFAHYNFLNQQATDRTLHTENRMLETIREHEKIVESMKNGSPMDAYNALIEHMSSTEKLILTLFNNNPVRNSFL